MSRYPGEKAWNARLTNAQAESARRRFAAGEATVVQLAAEHGCSYKTMWRAVNRVTYVTDHRH